MWLLPAFWGREIMAEVLPMGCDYFFAQLGLHHIEGFVESGNKNCKLAMAKLDFRHEDIMRDCEVKNKEFISVDIFAKLNSI